ncbi:ammonium transporter Rh type A-like [Bombina bombina]|uniref:ammonium transporter Rh type A-like n=1 Tax=Bombina bombina TaxID=8345 RepID=UPI00235A7B22|nr:ammonium transporter Rh type A-like [Bombina bombina]
MSMTCTPTLRCQFPVLLTFLQGSLIVVFLLFVRYDDHSSSTFVSNLTATEENNLYTIFPLFKDVNIMLFVGLGLMLSFFKLYGFGGIALNFLLANFSIQWSIVVQGFLYHYRDGKIHLGLENVLSAEFAAVTALISAGAILGRTSPVQLILLSILEIPLFVLNDWLINTYFHIVDVGGTVAIHIFSCYFGLGVSQIMYRPALKTRHPKEETTPSSDLLSLLGTIFLWIFWPSFNSVLATKGNAQHRAVLNTFLSLSSSTLTSFALSSLLDKKGRISLVHLQNATLAGGVAVGITADMMITPAGAFGLGCLASFSCILGFKYLSPFLAKKLKVQDQCGIHNLHGLPGIIGTIGSIVAILFGPHDIYGSGLHELLIQNDVQDGRNALGNLDHTAPYSATNQALCQAAAFAVTFGISLFGGYLTGFFLKLPCLVKLPDELCFDDQPYFQIPGDCDDKVITNNREREVLYPLKLV